MIPIRDTVPRRRAAFVTWLLIAVNVAVFVWEISLGAGAEREILRLAFVPARFLGRSGTGPPAPSQALSLLTSMFLHAGWLHVLGNMLYLYIFGDNVEDELGHVRFALFYGACGTAAALAQAFAEPSSLVPMVGASGAVAGTLGAFFVLFPAARVVTLVPVFVFVQVIEIPAFFFLLFWFLLQFASGALHLGTTAGQSGGVAWWAHVGGFATGLGIALILRIARAVRSGS